MSLTSTLFTGWHRVLATFHPDDQQRLLENLCAAYRAEARAVAQYTPHAHRPDALHRAGAETLLLSTQRHSAGGRLRGPAALAARRHPGVE